MDHRAWAQISLDAAAHNMREIRRITSASAQIMAVVKADAYGHGVYEMAKTFLANGADRLAVATIGEGKQLRCCGIEAPIMVLGAFTGENAEAYVRYDVIPSVFSYEDAKLISGAAVIQGKTAKIHIKLDTGMTRIGYLVTEDNAWIADEIVKISKLPGIEVEGMFSHFSTSDEYDGSYTRMQFARFMNVNRLLEERGLNISVKHICNSAGIMMYPEMHLDMVRPGIILYGLYPSNEVDRSVLDLKPVMTLKAKITCIKDTEPGRGVSYGKEYITEGNVKIATVPVGYADGYLRGIAHEGRVLVKGEKVPIIGRICMDQCMIDVTNVHNIKRGDEVILFSDSGITADDIARWLHTINYEVTCVVGKRVPRAYTEYGRTVRILDYTEQPCIPAKL